MSQGKLVAIQISKKKGLPMESTDIGTCMADFGLKGDIHGGKGCRQVSVMGCDSMRSMRESKMQGLCTVKFQANLMVDGMALWELPVGTKLRIGDSLHEISQVGKGCHAGCAILENGDSCILMQQAVFTRILASGEIAIGDRIEVVENSETRGREES